MQELTMQWNKEDMEGKWKLFKETVRGAPEEVLNKKKKKKKDDWFDEQCAKAVKER